MKIGLIGSGNMASALARGLGGPAVCSDVDPERASALAAELGGEAVATNAELVAASEVVILCHKPAQLASVAAELDAAGKIVVSLLGGVTLADVRDAYAGARVFRIMPNTAVEIRKGVVGLVDDDAGDPAAFESIRELFSRLGEVIVVPERLLGPLTGVSGVGPAYAALVAEAQIDAAVRAGFPAPLAARLVGAAMEGSAALLRERGMDTLAVRRAVTSPGGVTARGLSALEAGGLRSAFDDAMDAVLEAGA
jgi:pyrroline-5-carboxylate reductase